MTSGLFRLLEKHAAKSVPGPDIQEFLDNHFTSQDPGRWKSFQRRLRSRLFVQAVKQDPRADAKLKRYTEMVHKHLTAKAPTFRVRGSSRTYTVKYHDDIDRFTCSCPDWRYTRSHLRGKANQDCKHIRMVTRELEAHDMPRKIKTANVFTQALRATAGGMNAARLKDKGQERQIKAEVVNQAYNREFSERHPGPHGFRGFMRHMLHKYAAAVRGRAARRLLES